MEFRMSRAGALFAAAVGLAAVTTFPVLPPAAAADAPFYGESDIGLDGTVSSTLSRAGEVHLYNFFAPAGTVFNATLEAVPGVNLQPNIGLSRPGGSPVNLRRAQRTRNGKATISSFKLPFSGWFAIEVSAKSGSGAYKLTTSDRLPRKVTGLFAGAGPGAETWTFHAVGGSLADVLLQPGRRGGARPVIESVTTTDGSVIASADAVVGKSSRRGSKLDRVAFPEDGTYVVHWRNDGRKGDVKFTFTFQNPDLVPERYAFPAASGSPGSLVDSGEPTLDPLDGYAGSGTCGRCHDEIYRGWAKSLHNLAARSWDRAGLTGTAFVNDANKNGVDDFRDGLNLSTQAAFAAYGAAAPRLSYVGSAEYPYKMRIGSVTYDVARVMGGNGQWKQRYLLKVGNDFFPSPVQFNDVPGTYSAYDADDWYAGTAAKWTAATQIPASHGFAARCSGCHNTGERLTYSGGADGTFEVGHVDFNIGCEQCHGAGKEHAESAGDPTKIGNPARLLDGTPDGVAKANDVCGRCHTRGTARDAYPGVQEAAFQKAGFGYTTAAGVSHFGDDQHAFFDITTKSSDYWGQTKKILYVDPNPLETTWDDFTWVASKSHRQQQLDLSVGYHGPVAGYSPTCFACHDPHTRTNKFMIRAQVQAESSLSASAKPRAASTEITIATRADDNSLCLSCHAGFGPFAGVTKEQVAEISSGVTPSEVKSAVVDHMADSGMPAAYASYDPVGTQVGRCESCHMPLMAKSAVNFTDKAGFTGGGDEHAHTFQTVNPRVSRALSSPGTTDGPTNSCNVCHPTQADDIVGPIIAQWATDGPDADGTFHADRPSSFQNGKANAASPSGGAWCVSCHTTEGFQRIQVRGESFDQAKSDSVLRTAYARMKGISCDACHGARADGTFAEGRNPLRLPAEQLCGSCHNNQTVVFSDFQATGEMVRHPTREMVAGTAGAEVPGQMYLPQPDTGHALIAGGCIGCHYLPAAGDATHAFEPQIEACKTCHGAVPSFDTMSPYNAQDWDGDAVVEGLQSEVHGLLDIVEAAILAADPLVTFGGEYYDRGGASDHKLTGASDAVKRAAFNWYSVEFEGSFGVHNGTRSVQLLQKSYKELTGSDVPGAAIR